MKRFIGLVLLVAFFGTVYADVAPERRLPRPLVKFSMESAYQWLGPFAVPVMRLVAPRWPVVIAPRGYARDPQGDVPVPPVCGLSCLLRLVQGIAQ